MFNKLFSKILDSSIWLEPHPTRIVWITLLAAMDSDGYAHFSAIENLAIRARVSIPEAEAAVACFTSPDPNSENLDNEGRRVERVPGGFMILNAPKYRASVSALIERERTRLRVARFRAKQDVTAKALHAVTCNNSSASASVSVSEKEEGYGEKKEQDGVTRGYHENTRIVLGWLNQMAGKNFREVDSNLSLISQRLREPGVDLDGAKQMIERQCRQWQNSDMADYLRPETLFAKSKFDSYYANRELPIRNNNQNGKGSPQRWSRSAGTCNEGVHGQYRDAAKLQAAKRVQDQQRSVANGGA